MLKQGTEAGPSRRFSSSSQSAPGGATQRPASDFPPLSSLLISSVPRREPNPHGPVVYEEVFDLAQDIGLVIDPTNYFDHVTMSAYLWPYASREALRAATFFNVIGFYIDDTIGSDIRHSHGLDIDALRGVVANKALNIMLRGLIPASPDKYDRAFMDFYQMILELSDAPFGARFFPVLFEHWRAATRNYEANGPYTGTVEEFIPIRRLTGGMFPTILMIELAKQQYMPAWLPARVPSLSTAIDALADIGGLSNELFSYAKEVLYEGTTLNLLPIIQRQAGDESAVWAAHEAIALVNGCYELFRLAVQDVLAEASQIEEPAKREQAETFLKAFVDGMWDQVAASYHWQMEANRYRAEYNPFPELTSRLAA